MNGPRRHVPTHMIHFTRPDGNQETIEVMEDDNRLYTLAEWITESSADWELVEGRLRFQGQVPTFSCRIKKV